MIFALALALALSFVFVFRGMPWRELLHDELGGLGDFRMPILSDGRLKKLLAAVGFVQPASWSVANWYVDYVNGSDTKDGTSPANAVKTVMGGIVPKWGTISPRLAQTTTINVLSSQPVGAEAIVLAPVLVGPVNLIFQGTPTLLGTWLIPAASFLPKNRAANQQLQVGGFPATAAANMIVKNLTHPSEALIRSVDGATHIAQISQPQNVPVPGAGGTIYRPVVAEVDTWAAGDQIELYAQPAFNITGLFAQGGASDVAVDAPAVWFDSLLIPDASGVDTNSFFEPEALSGYLIFTNCDLRPYMGCCLGLQNAFINSHTSGVQGHFLYYLGGRDTFGIQLLTGSTIDNDACIELSMGVSGSDLVVGYMFIAGGQTCFVHPGAALRLYNSIDGTPGILWGTGTLECEADGTCWKTTVATWAASIFCGLSLNGAAVGTSYAAGVWTDGVALTPANLDANNGALQNPRSGARFTTGA